MGEKKTQTQQTSEQESMLGKVAFITGSTSRGIGQGIARHLAERGCSVIFTGLEDQTVKNDLLKTFKSSYKGEYHVLEGDLRKKEEVESLCQSVSKIYPDGIDILVNNAGIQHVCPVENYPLEKWDAMLAIQLTAPFQLIRHFLPGMKRKGWGRIINTSSQMGLISQPGKVPYSTVKSGLIGMAKGVALECAEYGVTCNAVCPGFVETEFVRDQIVTHGRESGIEDFETARVKYFADKNPTLQPVTVDQVASLVTYLCSDAAASITGSALSIDAGYTAK